MKNLGLLVILILLVFPLSSAIRINEVELNGVDGSEWVEIYNDGADSIDISNWELWDGLSSPKKIYTFQSNTTLNSGDYYILDFNNKLNNGGEFLTLYDNESQKIFETPLFEEKTKGDKTHNYCDSGWIFIESSKEQKNNCSQVSNSDFISNQEPEPEENQTFEENTDFEQQKSEFSQEQVEENPTQDFNKKEKSIQVQPINLNSNSIEEGSPKVLNKEINSAYYLISFCLLLGFLILLKARRKPKNEFR